MSRFLWLAVLAASVFLSSGCSSTAAVSAPSSYLLGEKAQVGKLIYTVFETQWRTHVGVDLAPRLPQSRFFLVRLSVVNSGSNENPVPDLAVVDDQGKAFEELSDGDGIPQWAGYLRTVKPSDSLQGNIAFDAPPAHYRLKLRDETGQSAAFVDIPLTFGVETPDVVTPPAQK